MRCELDREVFADVLGTVVRIVPVKSTYPVFQNILLEVVGNKLNITGTNGDTTVKKEISLAEPGEAGSVLVNGRKITELIRESFGSRVTICDDGGMLSIESGRMKASLVRLAPGEFPQLPPLPEEEQLEFPLATIFDMFDMCSFAVSQDEARPAMTGINWEITKTETKMVATDSYRLVCVTRKIKPGARVQGAGRKTKLLIDPEAIEILPRGEEKVEVFADSRNIGFKLTDMTVVSRTIEGPYPEYERVIPKGYPNRAKVNRDDLFAAVRRAQILAQPVGKQISLEFKKGELVVRSENPELGRSEEQLDCEFEGEATRIGFNGGYLLEILQHLSSDGVMVEFSGPMAPVLFKPEERKTEGEDLFILMPLRLD